MCVTCSPALLARGLPHQIKGVCPRRCERPSPLGTLHMSLMFDRAGPTCPTAGGDIPGINASNKVCCSTSCGTCGGSECSSRPGGKSSCCGSGVKSSGLYCDETNAAPCIIGSRPEGMSSRLHALHRRVFGQDRAGQCCDI